MQSEYITDGAASQARPPALRDARANGTLRPWRKHHQGTLSLAALYDYMAAEIMGPDPSGTIDPRAARYMERARALQACAPWAEFSREVDGYEPPKVGSGPPAPHYVQRLYNASFCRQRLCPMCQWRRSLKLGGQARQVVQWVEQRQPVRWLMLTVTLKNVSAAELSATVTHLHNSLTRLTHRQAWPAIGWLRATEVTYNATKDTYHPHMHILLCVKPSYFKGGKYLSADKWQQLWREAARLDYAPSIDIHVVRPRNGKDMGGAVAEITKYGAKPEDYIRPWDIDTSCKVIATLDTYLEGRRLTSWGGLCKDAAKALAIKDPDACDLVHIDELAGKAIDSANQVAEYITYSWRVGWGDYYRLSSREDMPPDVKRKVQASEHIHAAAAKAVHDCAEWWDAAQWAYMDRVAHNGRSSRKVRRDDAIGYIPTAAERDAMLRELGIKGDNNDV